MDKGDGVKIETTSVPRLEGFRVPDPFAPREQPAASFINALLSTAVVRCFHILLFFAGWATMVAVISHNVYDLSIQPTLLTVVGTVLGFVISYRTTSSFERYNEGRRLWSQIILASRTFARTVWFHVPDSSSVPDIAEAEVQARSVIEKKTVINLVEAYGVAIKHYLRNEDGIYYEDLYYLVKFLPEYALPAGRPSQTDLSSPNHYAFPSDETGVTGRPSSDTLHQAQHKQESRGDGLPFPASTPSRRRSHQHNSDKEDLPAFRRTNTRNTIIPRTDEAYLLPANLPPKFYIFNIYPFSLLENLFTKESKKSGKVRARLRNKAISHNIPLEISLYLSSYVAALQRRHAIDVPTTITLISDLLIMSLGQLVDSLTGLERILTTPIPFS
ncbi:hypothetical protein ONZ45_g7418 [Pleurotus djamor]|nr:hypothetical protein ONZ45_g7418 [Pleurotus djamor]